MNSAKSMLAGAAMCCGLGACDPIRSIVTTMPLTAPLDTTCLGPALAACTSDRLQTRPSAADTAVGAVTYDTRGARVEQTSTRGSLTTLRATQSRIGNKYSRQEADTIGAEQARMLSALRDSCRGHTPAGETITTRRRN